MTGHDDREAVAENNLSRARSIARRLTRHRKRDFEEAYSVALAALVESIRTFDPARGEGSVDQRFGRHANRTIGNRILDFFKGAAMPCGYRARSDESKAAAPEIVSLSALLPRRTPWLIPSTIARDGEPFVGWAIEWEDFVLAASRKLPPRHGEVIRWRYLHADAESLAGVAARMGLKEARVVQLHREALAMLRERYGPGDADAAVRPSRGGGVA